MNFSSGPLAEVIKALRQAFEFVGGGKVYQVHRGPIDYSSWPYQDKPRAVSIQVDDNSMFLEINDAFITIEMSGKFSNEELDDGVQDQFRSDLHDALVALQGARLPGSSSPVVIGMSTGASRVREFHDVSCHVQGIMFTFQIQY